MPKISHNLVLYSLKTTFFSFFVCVDERGHNYISEGQVFGTKSCFLIPFFFLIVNEKLEKISQLMMEKTSITRKREYFLSLNIVCIFCDGK